MKPIKSVFILMALCCCIPLTGQDYQQIPEGIKATINSVDVELQFYTPSFVYFHPLGDFSILTIDGV